jgi:hypothetical protein
VLKLLEESAARIARLTVTRHILGALGARRTEAIPRDIVRLYQSISRGVGHKCKPLDRADQLHVPLAQTRRKRRDVWLLG